MRLSKREIEIASLLACNNSAKMVAAKLKISHRTVEKHRQRICLKLNIHTTVALVHYALAKGWTNNIYGLFPRTT